MFYSAHSNKSAYWRLERELRAYRHVTTRNILGARDANFNENLPNGGVEFEDEGFKTLSYFLHGWLIEMRREWKRFKGEMYAIREMISGGS